MPNLRRRFAVIIFLAAFLLFLVEPIAAKQLLPVLGGSAAVWITCLVFFQTALLAGYLYAHWLTQRETWRMHLLLLSLATLAAILWAARPMASAGAAAYPVTAIFAALSISIGLPFVLLAATSPLLQVVWARLETGRVPYKLYALSNLASLLALALYPSIIEPHLTLRAQRITWCVGFAVFAALIADLLRRATSKTFTNVAATAERDEAAASAPLLQKILWVALPMAAAMQLSAITVHLTANIAAIPLLWILPLAVYLLTLILAFRFSWLLARGILARALALVLASIGYMLANADSSWPISMTIPFFLITLFVAGLFCHSHAYRLRPVRASETTRFYLLFAAGGALGSFLIAIASPLLFRFNYDLPLVFFVTALAALAATWQAHWTQRLLWFAASAAMLAVFFMVRIAYQHDTKVAVRNFYGSLRVTEDHYTLPGATVRTLLNGSIQHGTQIFGTDELRHTPTTYYAADSGIGLALRFCCAGHARNIGVVGLGAGTLAAYGQPGDHIRFYEINPADEPIARNLFTYIRESGAQVQVIPGDARISLSQEAPQRFDVLAIDAFSGDAIPLQLLTVEALALYRRHLLPGGILAFHISNQHVDLAPPIARLAQASGMQVRRVSSPPSEVRGEFGATWMLLSDDAAFFARPEFVQHAHAQPVDAHTPVWTDDYSALLPVLRW
ncbi:MAG: fused MFS/spermidine synthase [Acidobacteriota bacterium]|nr:fused MFS/spermidine synthase [Acidobacteriota bacterium]